jgi:hypothetical protein
MPQLEWFSNKKSALGSVRLQDQDEGFIADLVVHPKND